MVLRKNIEKKYALISVYNKKNLKYLCSNLVKNKYLLLSTGQTSKKIKELGYKCTDISNITKFKESFDGRVKTLDQKIYSSILYLRNNPKHKREFKKLNIPKIDITIIDLYPFTKFKNSKNIKKIIEMIDIGGLSILRASSKNYKFVTAISDVNDYKNLIVNIKKNNGKTDLKFREEMALKTFKLSSDYDGVIHNWFAKRKNKNNLELKYGENPDQRSYISYNRNLSFNESQLNGKDLSYNNIMDIDSGIKCLKEFNEPTCIILKHTNPCGIASSKSIIKSFKMAYQCDPISAFGGVVFLNKTINKELALNINKFFFEVVVAPNFEEKALDVLKTKRNLIVIKANNLKYEKINFRSTIFGTIYQENNFTKINRRFIELKSKKASEKNISDLLFAIKVVKHLKSNAIVLASNKQTLGIGVGQTSRIDALKLAITKMKINFKEKKYVCSSDGFFPFIDSLKLLKKNRCSAVAQPSGSINDKDIVNYCIYNNLPLYFVKNRLFKH